MFQYAMGRNLSIQSGLPLSLDIASGFKNDFYGREYSLQHFNISHDVRILDSKRYPKHLYYTHKLFKFLNIENKKNYLIVEDSFNYVPNLLGIRTRAYLDGYWQSEQYFESIKQVIKNEFSLKHALEGYNIELANNIESTNAVSLHIRKLHGVSLNGNVADNAVKTHGSCSLDYIREAVTFINSKVDNPVYYIFSDDFQWVKENIDLPNKTVMVGNDNYGKDYEDLRLMSLCKHNIVANSTFSWWGAWLNSYSAKIVIAPKIWFDDTNLNSQTSDLIPPEWVTL